jgi:hypothetical protein
MARIRFALALGVLALGVLAAAPASAQVTVIEDHQVPQGQVQGPVVEQGYVRGQGRGIQYGAHIVSPLYLSTVAPSDGRTIFPSGGAGLLARIGWEFPSGLTLEVHGGFAVNGVDRPAGFTDMSSVITRAEVGGGARYMFFNDTAFVPFVQVSGALRWFWFDYVDARGTSVGSQDSSSPTGALGGALGAQIELSPYFGIEAGIAVDYTFGASLFEEGFVSLMPFLGVTLYVYDSTGN